MNATRATTRKPSNAVRASIADSGFRKLIVVDESIVMIVGHPRLDAAKAQGLETARVHVTEGLTPARAYRLMSDTKSGRPQVLNERA